MSEVTVIGWFDQDSKTLWEFKPKSIVTNAVSVVLKSDYDAAQSELAALREELSGANRSAETLHEVIGRLKSERDAAEQRIADLCGLLVRTLPVVRMVGRQDHRCDYAMAGNIQAEIEITLNPKPTESGASE